MFVLRRKIITASAPDAGTLRVAAMFDGSRFHGPSEIEVDGEHITAVRPAGPETAGDVLDLGPESFLLPGLIDLHTHLIFDAGRDPVGRVTGADDEELLALMRDSARIALRGGVTTVRDLGDRNYLSVTLGAETEKDPGRGAGIIAAGPPITTPGGHCHFLGGEAAGAEALRAAVRERHDRGCAVVKIMASGGHITAGSGPMVAQFSREDLRVVVEEAHRLGLPVTAHAHSTSVIEDAFHAGVDGLEHASFLTPTGPGAPSSLLRGIAESRIVVVPTVGVSSAANDDVAANIRALIDSMVPTFRELHGLGARIVAGSDAGVGLGKPHDGLPYTLMDLARFGLDTAQVLAAATGLAAQAAGIDDRVGSIRPGMVADLLVVAGDPRRDLAALRAVRAVYRRGHRVSGAGASA